mmetsp:Transcript_2831/g.5599  ORF Transcript_2831/g.5599 Transcript_2831/m.5599 type:complete len:511 (+) Transcript_2831:1-1533(+)
MKTVATSRRAPSRAPRLAALPQESHVTGDALRGVARAVLGAQALSAGLRGRDDLGLLAVPYRHGQVLSFQGLELPRAHAQALLVHDLGPLELVNGHGGHDVGNPSSKRYGKSARAAVVHGEATLRQQPLVGRRRKEEDVGLGISLQLLEVGSAGQGGGVDPRDAAEDDAALARVLERAHGHLRLVGICGHGAPPDVDRGIALPQERDQLVLVLASEELAALVHQVLLQLRIDRPVADHVLPGRLAGWETPRGVGDGGADGQDRRARPAVVVHRGLGVPALQEALAQAYVEVHPGSDEAVLPDDGLRHRLLEAVLHGGDAEVLLHDPGLRARQLGVEEQLGFEGDNALVESALARPTGKHGGDDFKRRLPSLASHHVEVEEAAELVMGTVDDHPHGVAGLLQLQSQPHAGLHVPARAEGRDQDAAAAERGDGLGGRQVPTGPGRRVLHRPLVDLLCLSVGGHPAHVCGHANREVDGFLVNPALAMRLYQARAINAVNASVHELAVGQLQAL